jgi:actin-related protein 8
LQDYSAILLIPDLYDATYVREMADLLLRTIGFKQLCLQQVRLLRLCGRYRGEDDEYYVC